MRVLQCENSGFTVVDLVGTTVGKRFKWRLRVWFVQYAELETYMRL